MANVINGTNTGNTLNGTADSDEIYGFGGNDQISAGDGADILIGGTGNDSLSGGLGGDLFAFDARGFGVDVISDFGAGDKIDLRALGIGDLATLSTIMTQVGNDVVISSFFAGASETITV